MNPGSLPIPLPRLAASLCLVALALVLSRRSRLGLEGEIALGTVRAAVQLVAIGYALAFLFRAPSPALVLLVLAVMTVTAAWTSARRVRHGPSPARLFPYALASVVAGAVATLGPVFAFVVPVRPWLDPRYVIPLGGMMLSSAMNVVAQVFERLFARIHDDPDAVEQRLALGATPEQALAEESRAALRAALIPTINGLLTVGLVALPGMMTGQILSGAAPEQAVRYQLVVMYELVAVAAVSGTVAVRCARRLAFTARAQLVSRP